MYLFGHLIGLFEYASFERNVKLKNLIKLLSIVAISSKIHCAPIEPEKSLGIEVSKFYQDYFGKPQYSEVPKKYTLDFIPEEAKQESVRQGFHRKTEQILNFPTFFPNKELALIVYNQLF